MSSAQIVAAASALDGAMRSVATNSHLLLRKSAVHGQTIAMPISYRSDQRRANQGAEVLLEDVTRGGQSIKESFSSKTPVSGALLTRIALAAVWVVCPDS